MRSLDLISETVAEVVAGSRTIESRALRMGPRSVRSLETLGRRLRVAGDWGRHRGRGWRSRLRVPGRGGARGRWRLRGATRAASQAWHTVDRGTRGRGDFGRPRGARCLVQEAVTDDGRLTLATVKAAAGAGTVAANHVRASRR